MNSSEGNSRLWVIGEKDAVVRGSGLELVLVRECIDEFFLSDVGSHDKAIHVAVDLTDVVLLRFVGCDPFCLLLHVNGGRQASIEEEG